MEEITLRNISNQEVVFSDNAVMFTIRLHLFRGLLYADVSRDEEILVAGVRCVPNAWLLPPEYVTTDTGNFRFECETEDYPARQFFASGECVLKYYTKSEIADMEASAQ